MVLESLIIPFTACGTYLSTIKHIETPGTKLHNEWFLTPGLYVYC